MAIFGNSDSGPLKPSFRGQHHQFFAMILIRILYAADHANDFAARPLDEFTILFQIGRRAFLRRRRGRVFSLRGGMRGRGDPFRRPLLLSLPRGFGRHPEASGRLRGNGRDALVSPGSTGWSIWSDSWFGLTSIQRGESHRAQTLDSGPM